MANILNMITIGEKDYRIVDAIPSASAGTSAPLGSVAVYENGTTASFYLKTGVSDTAWDMLSTTASSGAITSGVEGRLTLYPTTGNTLADTYIQNSQNINVAIVTQPTRSAAITYTIPNPGDAVTTADLVLTEGAQTINGAKTFGNNVVISGDLTVNGTTTSVNSANLDVADKAITLNKGGATASGAGSGIEIEENAAITAYMKLDATRAGWAMLAPSSANVADLLLSSLTTGRSYTLPDLSGTFALGIGAAGQVSYWNGTNSITGNANFFWDNTNTRLGIGNGAPTDSLHVTGTARVTSLTSAAPVRSSATGVLSNGNIALGSEVSGVLPLTNGGTNASLTAVAGAVTYSDASALALSAAGTAGQALLSGGTTAPTWFTSSGVVKATSGVLSTSNVSLTTEVSGILPIANGGTNSSTALNSNRIMVSSAGAIVEAAALTNGQLLIGSTGAAPVAAALTGTTNQVNVTNAAGSITLSTPQNIHTAATPTFAAETLTGAGAFFDLNDTTAAMDMKMTMATVNTTDATVTTIATIATVTDSVMVIEAKITGLRTGGTAGTAGDSCAYIRTARISNIGGTVTISNLQSDFTSEANAATNGTITVSGTNVLVRVTGAANNNYTFKSLVTKII